MLDRLIRAFLVVGSVSVACAWTWPGAFPAADPRRPVGRRVARGHLCAPPASPHVAMRRFGTRSFSAAQLIAQGALPAHIPDEAERVLHTRRNILVSGGTASGNTTLLNVLIALIPDDQRIVAIEDTLELPIDSPNRVRFEARRLQQGAAHDPRPRAPRLAAPARSHRRRRSARHRSGRPVASPQHRTRRLARHRPRQQRRECPLAAGELRHAGRRRPPVGGSRAGASWTASRW